MNTPLAPGLTFTPIDPSYHKVLRVNALIWCGIGVLADLIAAWFWEPVRLWIIAILPVLLILSGISIFLARRRARAIGYFEGEEDLIVCRGIMFRKLQVIPYGRMQQVDVKAGPLLRRYGLANVAFVTASANGTAVIPGVKTQEADRLRVKLTALGASQMEGL